MANPRGGGPALPPSPALGWEQLAADAPDGLAVLDAKGRFVQLNHAAVRLCGRTAEDLAGAAAPFDLGRDDGNRHPGLFEDVSAERFTTWSPRPGVRREFAYRLRRGPALTMVSFRDVTEERHRHRRVAAIARTAEKLASQGSLRATLDALAAEVVKTDALAGVQILALDGSGHSLRIMGCAGFRNWPDFFHRLTQVRERGGALRMLDALASGEPVVVTDRWTLIQKDPAWEPLLDYMGEVPWESFASVPLLIRGQAVGVLNAFFAPGQAVGPRTLEFLIAMAEQAAIAVDYAALMHRERDAARREERQRLARDLHDSIVQQVFSISMQAKSIEVLGQRGGTIPAETVRRIADEVGQLSQTVLADLRAMVHELRPSSAAELGGLEEAIRALVDSTTDRTGLRFGVSLGKGLEQIEGEMAEDVYRIIAEAIHNVVKHAEAGRVTIGLAVRDDRLTVAVSDDGHGIGVPSARGNSPGPDSGYGLTIMQERAQRWGGTMTVRPRRGCGTTVRLAVPLAVGIPPAGPPVPIGTEWNPVAARPGPPP